MLAFLSAGSNAACEEKEGWFNRSQISVEYGMQGFWGSQAGEVQRAGDGYSWETCDFEKSPVWLWLQCAPPTMSVQNEQLPGQLPNAILMVDALPSDPAPLNVINPADWPQLVYNEITGNHYHFKSEAELSINGQAFDATIQKAGSDWSFVTTKYEMFIDNEAYGLLSSSVNADVTLETKAGEFSLRAKFEQSSDVEKFVNEMNRHCPLTEQERLMTPEEWARHKTS